MECGFRFQEDKIFKSKFGKFRKKKLLYRVIMVPWQHYIFTFDMIAYQSCTRTSSHQIINTVVFMSWKMKIAIMMTKLRDKFAMTYNSNLETKRTITLLNYDIDILIYFNSTILILLSHVMERGFKLRERNILFLYHFSQFER